MKKFLVFFCFLITLNYQETWKDGCTSDYYRFKNKILQVESNYKTWELRNTLEMFKIRCR